MDKQIENLDTVWTLKKTKSIDKNLLGKKDIRWCGWKVLQNLQGTNNSYFIQTDILPIHEDKPYNFLPKFRKMYDKI